MRTTLADLYTHCSARLAAHVAASLDKTGAGDPLADTDDVTQDVWLQIATLDVLPAPDQAWEALARLADQMIEQREQAEYRVREIPSGVALAALRVTPPAPMPNNVVIGGDVDAESMTVAA